MAIAGCLSCAGSYCSIKASSSQTSGAQNPCTASSSPNSRLQISRLYVADCKPSTKPNRMFPGEHVRIGHLRTWSQRRKLFKEKCKASISAVPAVEVQECSLPSWAEFEMGRAPVLWKTKNGLPPASGEILTLFYNPSARNLAPNKDFGIAFNGFGKRIEQRRCLRRGDLSRFACNHREL